MSLTIKKESSISIVNVKINEFNEIEYIDDVSEEIEEATEAGSDADIDEENVLVNTGDGVMTIKVKTSKQSVLQHICSNCNKTYKSVKVRTHNFHFLFFYNL